MMTNRKKLVELLDRAHHNASCVVGYDGSEGEALEEEARYLIAGGVVVREKGKWLFEETYPGVVSLNGYTCSKCGKNTAKKTSFCPNCGSDMREEHT